MGTGTKGDFKETIFSEVNDNLKALERLFPSAVKDGQVDFEALREALGEFEEVGPEKYELTWSGKKNAKKVSQQDIIAKTLKYIPEDSVNPDTTENLYIEGDNLEVLKLLRQNYYGSIKMIYIDPPYNTGNDFLYNDNFNMDKAQSDIEEGDVSEIGERYTVNSKSSNKYHAKWLNMMYPRLKVAKDLLKEDGVIFISIDDKEVNNLKKICDEIFGEDNFVNTIAVKMSEVSGNKMAHATKKLPKVKEYLLVYRKNMINLKRIKIRKFQWDKEYNIFLENFTLKDRNIINEITEKDKRSESDIDIVDNILSKIETKALSKKISELEISNEDELEWKLDNSYRICRSASSSSVKKLTDIKRKINLNKYFSVLSAKENLLYIAKSDYSEESNNPRVQILFADDNLDLGLSDMWVDINTTGLEFEGNVDYKNGKKPLKLIDRIIQMVTDRDDIVMDFFAGSSTTAESIIKNNSMKEHNNKFIMIQYPELLEDSLKKASGDSKKDIIKSIEFLDSIKKPRILSEIGKERIRRAGEKIVKENKDKEGIENLDIGFKVFRVGDTNIRWIRESEELPTLASEITSKEDVQQTTFNYIAATTSQVDLDGIVSPKDRLDFMPGFKDIDVVYELLLRQRDIPLSAKVRQLNDIGGRTYLFDESFLVCLEEDITNELVEKLASINPLPIKFILRDSAFGDDINLKDETNRRLKTLIERNTGETKKTYTVEYI